MQLLQMRAWSFLFLFLCTSVHGSHPANVLETLHDYVPVLKFTETVSQTVVGAGDNRETVDNYSGSFQMVVGSDELSNLTGTSIVRIRIGEFLLDTTLGSSPDYVAGGNRATFPILDGTTTVGSVKAKWAGEKLTITGAIKSRVLPAPAASFLVPKLTEDERYFITEATDASLIFGSIAGNRKIEVKGKSTFRAFRIGPADNPVYEDTLWKVSASGSLDFIAPKVNLLFPQANTNATPQRYILSTPLDVEAVTVRLNDADDADPVVREIDLTKKPKSLLWDGLLYLVPGVNTLTFNAIDRSGNSRETTVALAHDFRSGVYSGILDTGTEEMTRTLVLKVSDGGAFTGTLMVGNEKFPLGGAFDTNGMASFELQRRKGGTPISVNLRIAIDDSEFIGEPDAKPTVLTATIVDTFEYTLDAYRAVYDSESVQPSVVSGYYTARIAPDPLLEGTPSPSGTGYIAMKVERTGAIRAVGKVADGTPFSSSGLLGGDGRFLVYSRLYASGDGFVQGFLSFTPALDNGGTCEGQLRWVQPEGAKKSTGLFPDGFSALCEISGGIYIPGYREVDGEFFEDFPALGFTEAQISFLLGDFGDTAFTREFDTDFKARILRLTAAPEEKMKLTIKNKTGIFTGRFRAAGHSTPEKKFFGAIIGQDGLGEGGFISKTDSGSVTIEPR
jgi:hypothetical protein